MARQTKAKEDRGAPGLQELLDAASRHGKESIPDHEIGDLQEILRACWARLAPACRDEVLEEFAGLVEDWS